MNTNGVFFTAQAAGQQMARFGRGGSIIIVASIAGSIAAQVLLLPPQVDCKDLRAHFQGFRMVAYNSSKSAILQMARSMACELGGKKIRVNTLSHRLVEAFFDKQPELLNECSRMNPLGRIARPDELRGVVTWLASDASTFCNVNVQYYCRWWTTRMVEMCNFERYHRNPRNKWRKLYDIV